MKEGKKQAGDIMEQLSVLVDMIDPSARFGKKVAKNKASLLKDLTGSASASTYYQGCIEKVCDDLLEVADKHIDQVAHSQAPGVKIDHAKAERRMKTENALKKP